MSVAPQYDLVHINEAELARVAGNAPVGVKRRLLQILATQCVDGLFGAEIARSVRVTKADVSPRAHTPSRMESVVIWEMTVSEDMIDELDHLAVGSLAFFVDLFATFPLVVQGAIDGRLGDAIGVSQSMHFVFHGNTRLGARLSATSSCIAMETRMMSGRCEIRDKDSNRLVCSGVHLKMSPSASKL